MRLIRCITIAILFLKVNNIYSQDPYYFEVWGDVQLIAEFKDKYIGDFKLSNGDVAHFKCIQGIINVSVSHKGKITFLTAFEDSESNSEYGLLRLYEYDLDQDNENELIVMYNPTFSIIDIEIYRYSNALNQLVFRDQGQFKVVFDRNMLYLPIGSQGIEEQFIYLSGDFYELTYHDPNN